MDARQVDLLFGRGSPGWYDRQIPNYEAEVIDKQDQVERLLRRLTDVLPLAALASPALTAYFRGRSSTAKITWIAGSPKSCMRATKAASCAT